MEIGEGLKWIGGTLVGILGLIGFGKLAEMTLARIYKKKDDLAQIHESNQVAQIELDKLAFVKVIERVDKLEIEVKELREKLSSQMKKNARLEVENEHLKQTNERQQKEIENLRNREAVLQSQVNSLTNIVTKLQTELEMLKQAKSTNG